MKPFAPKPSALAGIAFLTIAAFVSAAETPSVPSPSAHVAGARPAPPLPPMPPLWSVGGFRELLQRSPQERATLMANLPPAQREFLQRKLNEYDALPAAERELRLRTSELRHLLVPLLRLSSEQRAGLLERVPEETRALLGARLAQWDALAAEVRQEFFDNHMVLDYFARVEGLPADWRARDLATMPESARQKLDAGLTRWNSLGAPEQQRIAQQSAQFFELNEAEKQLVLAKLPVSDRETLRVTVTAIEQLPAGERDRCLEALRQFTAMSPEQRQRFMGAVARWQAMSPEEQNRWREISRKLPPLPPLPPGLAPPALAGR
jgi:hypothetical protein